MLFALALVTLLGTVGLLAAFVLQADWHCHLSWWQVPSVILGFRYALKTLGPALRPPEQAQAGSEVLFERPDASRHKKLQVRALFALLYLQIFAVATVALLTLIPPCFPGTGHAVTALSCLLLGAWAQWDGVHHWFPRFLPGWALVCTFFIAWCLCGCVGDARHWVGGAGEIGMAGYLVLFAIELRLLTGGLRGALPMRAWLAGINLLQAMMVFRPAVPEPVKFLIGFGLWCYIGDQVRPRAGLCSCERLGDACGDHCVLHQLDVHVQQRVQLACGPPPWPERTPDHYAVRKLGVAYLVGSNAWLDGIESELNIRYVNVRGVPYLADRAGPSIPDPPPEQWEECSFVLSCAKWYTPTGARRLDRAETDERLAAALRDYRAAVGVWELPKLTATFVFLCYKILLLCFGDPTGCCWQGVLPCLAAYFFCLCRAAFHPRATRRTVQLPDRVMVDRRQQMCP